MAYILSSLLRNLLKNDNCIDIFRIEYMSSINPKKKIIVQMVRAIYRFPMGSVKVQILL